MPFVRIGMNSLHIMISRSVHANGMISFFFFLHLKFYLRCVAHFLLFLDGHLGWFHFLAILNCAAISITVQESLCYGNLESAKYRFRLVELDHMRRIFLVI